MKLEFAWYLNMPGTKVNSGFQQLGAMLGVRLGNCEALQRLLKVRMSCLTSLLGEECKASWMKIEPLLEVAGNDVNFPSCCNTNAIFQHVIGVVLESLEFDAEGGYEIGVVLTQLMTKAS